LSKPTARAISTGQASVRNTAGMSRPLMWVMFTEISWPAVSRNLRVLCDAGLLSQRKVGHFRLYQANHDAVGPLEPFLRAMWAADLDQLRQVVERDQRERLP
jgi:hypothetical protein